MKKAVYFPVSTTHYSSTLSLNIRRTKGWSGYGQYIAILQMLANSKTRKLSLNEIPDIAFNLHMSEDDVENVIQSYFVIEGQQFYSAELEEALSYFDAKYNAASKAGKKSASLLTPEERKEKAIKASSARWNNDANTLASVSIDAHKPQQNANNKIKENRIEENIIQKNRTEQNNKKENKNEEKNIEQISSPISPVDIQNEIDEYLKSDSKFFKGDNQALVPNSFTEYYKQYPNTQLSITKYEQVLYVHLMQATMSVDVNALNEYLTNTPITVNPANTHDIVKMVNDNSKAQVIFKNIIEKVNHITDDNNRD